MAPTLARFRRLLGLSRSVRAAAVETFVIEPGAWRHAPAAIALPNEFDRVVAVQSETSLDREVSRVEGGARYHDPTVAYRLRDVLLADGRIYFEGGYDGIRPQKWRRLITGKIEHLDRAALTTSVSAERYFGHWLRDTLLTEQLAAERDLHSVGFERPLWQHEAGYRQALGLDTQLVSQTHIEEMWLFDDFGLNEGMVRRLELSRSRLAATRSPIGASHFFMRRGSTGSSRSLANQDEIETRLIQRGFTVIDPETISAAALIEALGHARVVVLVEGSAQNHVLFSMARGGALVTIEPPNRFNAVFKPYADAIGLAWAYTVADAAEGGFTMPEDRLLRTIDLAEARCAAD